MPYKERKNRRLDITINPDLLQILKAMHIGYKMKYDNGISFTLFIQSLLASHLKSESGKSLLEWTKKAKKEG